MKKRTACILTALAAVLGLGIFTGAPARASSGVSVTYRVPFFKDVVREVAEYSAPENLSIGEICSAMYGFPDHRLATDGLTVEWYADAAFQTPYGFDEALSEPLTLYGKVTESETYAVRNGYGWDLQSGRTYAGDPIRDNYITSNEYAAPSYTDPETGDASFRFEGIQYGVYARGLDVSVPFDVTFDFTDIRPDNGTCWFEFSLFPALTLAQFGAQVPWANFGAASCMMFNLGSDPVGQIQPIQAGGSAVNLESTTQTDWAENGAVLQSLLSQSTELALTVEIGEEGTVFRSGGQTVATSPAKRADFPSGYAYLSFASNGSPSAQLGVDISIRQSTGSATAQGDAHVSVSDVRTQGMAVTAKIVLEEGYELTGVTVNGTAAKAVRLYGEEDRYAIDLANWQTGSVEIAVTSGREGGTGEGGCGCSQESAEAGLLAVLSLALAGVCFKLK